MTDDLPRFTAPDLTAFATRVLEAEGLAPHMAATVAEALVESDLMGHDTHGLAQLAGYAAALRSGGMAKGGAPEVLSDRAAAALWDGRHLPGPWLVSEGFRLGIARAGEAGTFTLSIRRSHHTAGHVAYLRRVTEAGMIAILAASDPTEVCVAPFGGAGPALSTNPIAFGIPGDAGPILIDMSTSVTTNGMVGRLTREGRQFDHPWLIGPDGQPSRDPGVRRMEPPGAILPLGGMEAGYKGTALGLTVEALTHGLSGNPRALDPNGWEANVFLQVIDPAAFGGTEALMAETGALARAVRATRPADPARPVRMPGDRALALRAERLEQGVPLARDLVAGLAALAEGHGLTPPASGRGMEYPA